ncbi:uncharacterized protein F4822DRAFT_398399 [Hypoxylon trugodes]|uniref:uncharacterized protein n=1 Tax=Hypoxylon trugodes TaxID=326681 RepID=UPI002194C3ED|nr:uncharacterized protein F4822DRAFT_398399 [Hypoxylon trugodes]KAI1389457.1 hypothetical protein F4822DRAFT_398399 [Hypoxylon trugodes]
MVTAVLIIFYVFFDSVVLIKNEAVLISHLTDRKSATIPTKLEQYTLFLAPENIHSAPEFALAPSLQGLRYYLAV